MKSQERKRIKQRLEALGVESSPVREQFRQVYGQVVSNISEVQEIIGEVEGEQHGSLEYAVSSMDTDLRLIKQQKGQDNYQNLLGHINGLEEVNQKLIRVEELCKESETLLEWLSDIQEKNDFHKNDLGDKYEQAERLGEETQNLIREIRSIAEDRFEIVKEFLQNVEDKENRAWNGGSQGLKYAARQLNSIIEQDF